MNIATIGASKKHGSELVGDIKTLNMQKNMRIVPETNRPTDIASKHQIYFGKAEIDAA